MNEQSGKNRIGMLVRAGWLFAAATGVGCSMMHSNPAPAPIAPPTAQLASAPPPPATPAAAMPAIPSADGQSAATNRVADVVWPAQAAATPYVPQITPALNVFGELNGTDTHSAAIPTAATGFEQHTFLDEGYDSDVCVDPTGKWMVFTSTRHSDHPNICMQRVDGQSVIQLTNDDADYAYPTFSPDGKMIAFCSTRAGNWDIYVMDTDGKNMVQVTSGPMQHVHPSFSPDGTRLVFSALGGKTGQWELWTVNLTTGEQRMIGLGLFPAWSPEKDMDRIAFQRARQRGGRWFTLWTLELVDGESRRVTEIAASSNAAIVSPSWSPDGTSLAFTTITEPDKAEAMPVGQEDIWTTDADGGNRQRLTDGVGVNLQPFWAKDSKVYFVSDRSGVDCIWSVNGPRDIMPMKLTDAQHPADKVTPPAAPQAMMPAVPAAPAAAMPPATAPQMGQAVAPPAPANTPAAVNGAAGTNTPGQPNPDAAAPGTVGSAE